MTTEVNQTADRIASIRREIKDDPSNSTEHVPELVTAVTDFPSGSRAKLDAAFALHMLGKHGVEVDPDTVETLLTECETDDERVRAQVSHAVTWFVDTSPACGVRLVDEFATMLQSEYREARDAGSYTMGVLADAEPETLLPVVDDVIEYVRERDEVYVYYAIEALHTLVEVDSDAVRGAASALRRHTRHSEEDVRVLSLLTLGRLCHYHPELWSDVRGPIHEGVTDGTAAVADAALSALIGALSGDPEVDRETLGDLGDDVAAVARSAANPLDAVAVRALILICLWNPEFANPGHVADTLRELGRTHSSLQSDIEVALDRIG